MKMFTSLKIAALTFITLNGSASAQKAHTLDDLHEAEQNARKAAFIQRRLALKDPKALAQMKAQLNVEEADKENQESFQGEGQRLGGDLYINRLLGINHKEGKKLARLAKKQAKKAAKAARKAEKAHLAMRASLDFEGFERFLAAPAA